MFENVPMDEVVAAVANHDFVAACEGTVDQQMGADEIDAIVACERLLRHAQATQAQLIAQVDAKRAAAIRRQVTAGGELVDGGRRARSLITEIAMARQMSAHGAETQYGFALQLRQMPQTAALFASGMISERVARAVATECGTLSDEDATRVDAALAGWLPELTARRAAAAARRQVIAVDPHAATDRRREEQERRSVSARARPDGMGELNAYLTAEEANACFDALDSAGRGLRSEGDPRTITQIMADTLVERVTGLSRRRDDGKLDLDVEVHLVMRPETLFGAEDTPALLAGHGPVPAEIARELTGASQAWVSRLFTDPAEDRVTGRDPERRRFDGALGDLIRAADQHCQRPWCDGRIVEIDHRRPYAAGGATTRPNADSYCRRSHTVKHLDRWAVRCVQYDGDIPAVLEWKTPTGHRYRSRRPAPLGHGPPVVVPRVAASRAGPRGTRAGPEHPGRVVTAVERHLAVKLALYANSAE